MKRDFKNLPSLLSFGRFDAEEDKIIVENLENLVKRAKMNSIGEVLDVALALSDENRVTRIEIIGSYLSQGLQKIRLPQMVFHEQESCYLVQRDIFLRRRKE